MVSLAEALELLWGVLAPLPQLPATPVPLERALGRVLARDVGPAGPVPPEPRAAMDGFALAAADLNAPAGAVRPLADVVLAGMAPRALEPGTTVFVATGAVLPAGTAAVVPRESARWAAPEGGGEPPPRGAPVTFRRLPPVGANVLAPGELVPGDGVLLRAGTRLGAAALGVLAAAGRARVWVRVAPRVSILATGDELVPPGAPLPPGGVHEGNSVMLAAACRQLGARVRVAPPLPDRLEVLLPALEGELQRRPHLILTTGGVSVGPADAVPAAWRRLGARELFWRVALKPGKPVYAAQAGATAVIGLSGSPLACWTVFTVLVEPLLRHWLGQPYPFPPAFRGVLAEAVPAADVPALLWAEVGPGVPPRVRPQGRRAAGKLAAMARAGGLLLQPAGSPPLAAGAPAWVLLPGRAGEPGEADARALLAAASRPGAPELALPPAVAPGAPLGICAVGGPSGHGKTTLIDGLIRWFTAQGEPVATVKHHAHGAPEEVPGKDSTRHRAAGARLTWVAGPGGLLWSEAAVGEPAPEDWLPLVAARARALGCRWLLVEGYHSLPVPRLEVLDVQRCPEPRTDPAHGLFLIAASDPARVQPPPGVAVLPRDDIAAIAAAVRQRCGGC